MFAFFYYFYHKNNKCSQKCDVKNNTYSDKPIFKEVLQSSELVLTILLLFLSCLGAYICFNTERLLTTIVFAVVSLVLLFLFSWIQWEKVLKHISVWYHLLFVVFAIYVLLTQNKTGYLEFATIGIISIETMISLMTVFSAGLFCLVCSKLKDEKKILSGLLLFIPAIIISAFNSPASVFVYIVVVVLSYVLASIDVKYINIAATYTIILIGITTFVWILFVVFTSTAANNFTDSFSGKEITFLSISSSRFMYLIYKSGLIFSLFFVATIVTLCLIVIRKAFFIKSLFGKTIVFSVAFSLYLSLVLSISLELIRGNSGGLSLPFFSGTPMMSAIFQIGIMIPLVQKRFLNKDSDKFKMFDILKKNHKRLRKTVAFISYRRSTGSDLAMHIHDRLLLKGKTSFYDVDSMRSGKFNEQIYDKIDECENFILVLTEGSLERCINKDDWVRKEIEYALKTNKNIIPIMAKDFAFPNILPSEIDEIRYYHGVVAANELFDEVIEKLIKLMK